MFVVKAEILPKGLGNRAQELFGYERRRLVDGKSLAALKASYQHADEETVLPVVLGKELRKVV